MWTPWSRRSLGSAEDRATYETLHTASLAAPALRRGLDEDSASASLKHLRTLLGAPSVALTDTERVLAVEGSRERRSDAMELARQAIAAGATQAFSTPHAHYPHAIVAPLTVEDTVVGALVVRALASSAGLARATTEVARWMSSQLELAELDKSRTALMEAELRALRAQISPHFVYNSLGAIASFVRTDPERARELATLRVLGFSRGEVGAVLDLLAGRAAFALGGLERCAHAGRLVVHRRVLSSWPMRGAVGAWPRWCWRTTGAVLSTPSEPSRLYAW